MHYVQSLSLLMQMLPLELHSSLNTILLETLNKPFLKQSVRLLRNLNLKHQEKLQPIFIKLTNFRIKILLMVVSK